MKFKYLFSLLFLSKNSAEIVGLGQNVAFGGLWHYNFDDSWSGGVIAEYNFLSNFVNPFCASDISRQRIQKYLLIGGSFLKKFDEQTIESVLFGVNVGISKEYINNNLFNLNWKVVEGFCNFNFLFFGQFSVAIGVFNLRCSLRDAFENGDYKIYLKVGLGAFCSNSIDKYLVAGKFTISGKIIKDEYTKSQLEAIKCDEIEYVKRYFVDRKIKREETANRGMILILDYLKTDQGMREDIKNSIKNINNIFSITYKISEVEKSAIRDVESCRIQDMINGLDLFINNFNLNNLIKSYFYTDSDVFCDHNCYKATAKELVPDEYILQILEDISISNLNEKKSNASSVNEDLTNDSELNSIDLISSDKEKDKRVVEDILKKLSINLDNNSNEKNLIKGLTESVEKLKNNYKGVEIEKIRSLKAECLEKKLQLIALQLNKERDSNNRNDEKIKELTEKFLEKTLLLIYIRLSMERANNNPNTKLNELKELYKINTKRFIIARENKDIDKEIFKLIFKQSDKGDIRQIAAYFITQYEKLKKTSYIQLSPDTHKLLCNYNNNLDDYKYNLALSLLYKDIMTHVKTSTVYGQTEEFKSFMLGNESFDSFISNGIR